MEISKETEKKLKEIVEKTLSEVTTEMKDLNEILKLIEIKDKIDNIDENLKDLASYRLLIGILTADLCSVILMHLKAGLKYETLYLARQMIVNVNEGFKLIYGFITQNIKGELVVTNRNNSLWIKDIGSLIKNNFPDYEKKYSLITEQLNAFSEKDFIKLKSKNYRCLSVHYDKETIKVYDMLLELDTEEVLNVTIDFLEIIKQMFGFTKELLNSHNVKTIDILTKNT
ncbi:hypothetical protein MG290_14425 (plasmid) [Flavobacterium sp. CBA20B-1]|uniref:hypothetical protein n=1 Tax=unclassified Flavobacterium TaxID=196869 RepID=UPI0022254E09|nr:MULTISPECIES: hypothetical protein [unclassified Flavobacterium]WCM43581.1 hypothetical protein MG290_14425 [Flavobacterium sp. CBA20B-1]